MENEVSFWVYFLFSAFLIALGFLVGYITYSTKIEELQDDNEALAEENIELYNELNAIRKGDLNKDGKTTPADLSAYMKRYNANRT